MAIIGSPTELSAPGEPISRATQTVSSSVVGLPEIPRDAVLAFVQVQTARVRWGLVGSEPSASAGQRVGVDDLMKISGQGSMRTVRFIRESTTDATLDVVFFAPVVFDDQGEFSGVRESRAVLVPRQEE